MKLRRRELRRGDVAFVQIEQIGFDDLDELGLFRRRQRLCLLADVIGRGLLAQPGADNLTDGCGDVYAVPLP